MTSVIQTSSLGYKQGTSYLLRNIDWTVNIGERWVLFGLNGSGKTTLLSILSGYMANTHGTLELFGQTPNADNILELRNKIGLLSNSFFDRYYTKEVALNIVLSGTCSTLGLNESVESDSVIQAKHLLNEFGLSRKMYYPYNLLSKGERQLVLLARALLNHPKLLLLDEPCSGLDIVMRSKLLEAIEQYAKIDNLSLIYVTHVLEEVPESFNQCLFLRHGEVAARGEMKEIFNDQTLSHILKTPLTVSFKDGHYFVKPTVTSKLQNWFATQNYYKE